MEVLVVVNSPAIRSKLQHNIESNVLLTTRGADSQQVAKALVDENGPLIKAAIVDINLPDAKQFELIDYLRDKGIAVIAITSTFNENIRQELLSRQVVDYILKSNVDETDNVVNLIRRVHANLATGVLVVDEDEAAGDELVKQLKTQGYQVKMTNDPDSALEIIRNDDSIQLMISDARSIDSDSAKLVIAARELKKRDELAIVVIPFTTGTSESIGPRALKAGANDFLCKPFSIEEFHNRINQNIDIIRLNKKIKDNSVRDHLTNVYNRQFLYESGRGLHANAKRGNGTLAAALVGIDQLKQINEEYGQEAGDRVMTHVAATIASSIRQSDIVARYSDTEFCILLNDALSEHLGKIMNDIRSKVETTRIMAGNNEIRFTISVGVCEMLDESFDALINHTDVALDTARKNGRNSVHLYQA